MTAPIADGVMAATHKLVQQAMTGQWQEVPKTIQERRDLLARISSTRAAAGPAVAERAAPGNDGIGCRRRPDGASAHVARSAVGPASAGQSVETKDAVTTVMDMLGKGG